MDLRSFSQQIERSGKLIFPTAALALLHYEKTANARRGGFNRVSEGENH
jgi:hypothetical protein